MFNFKLVGLNSASCARMMNKSSKAIIEAKNSSPEKDFRKLHLDPISRDKISKKLPLLEQWVEKLDLKSGNDYFDISEGNEY